MHVPPSDPPTDPPSKPPGDSSGRYPTWRRVLAGYALVAAFPAALWILHRPLAGATILGAVAGLYVLGPRAAAGARCVSRCRSFTVDLGGRVRITVAKTAAGDPT